MRTKTPVLARIRLIDSSGSDAAEQGVSQVYLPNQSCPTNHAQSCRGYELLAVSPLA